MPDEGEFFSTLRYAWDALAYDYYPPGSRDENLAGSTIKMYYQHDQAIGEPEFHQAHQSGTSPHD